MAFGMSVVASDAVQSTRSKRVIASEAWPSSCPQSVIASAAWQSSRQQWHEHFNLCKCLNWTAASQAPRSDGRRATLCNPVVPCPSLRAKRGNRVVSSGMNTSTCASASTGLPRRRLFAVTAGRLACGHSVVPSLSWRANQARHGERSAAIQSSESSMSLRAKRGNPVLSHG